LEIWLYTHVLTMGTWVAEEEGWLTHPRYIWNQWYVAYLDKIYSVKFNN
jgi:hypothetical protein